MEKTIAVAERLRDLFRGHYAFAALSATRLRATLRLSLHEGSPFKFIDRSFGYAKTQTVIGLRQLWMKVWT